MRPSARPKPLKLGGSINKLTRFVYVTVENQREREVSKQAKARERERERERMGEASSNSTDDDLLLKNFFAEVSEVERDNEVNRFSLSLSLCDSLHFFAPSLIFFFLFFFFLFSDISA